jgi:aryl-alcohol dehydrogenase-like predicted oxidoreductase
MNYRNLGTTSLQISEIGFGCMSLQGNESSDIRLIGQAIEAGINYFDTADLYDKGENESRLGKALKNNRKNVLIGTKVGNQWNPDGIGWSWNPTKDYILKAAEDSLRRLGTDYIDLYLLHGGTEEDSLDEILEAFEYLRNSGKIRFAGISSIRPAVIRRFISRSSLQAVMMQYSIIDRRPEENCLDLIKENGCGILARGVLAKGILAGKPAKSYLEYSENQINHLLKGLSEFISPERNLISLALQFVLKNPIISSAVVGIRTSGQLRELIKSRNPLQIKGTDWDQILKILPSITYRDHR